MYFQNPFSKIYFLPKISTKFFDLIILKYLNPSKSYCFAYMGLILEFIIITIGLIVEVPSTLKRG